MQHSRQAHVAAPFRFSHNLVRDVSRREGCSDDFEILWSFHWRIAGHGQPIHRGHANLARGIRLRQRAFYGNLQFEVLSLHQFAVGDLLPAARHHAIGNAERRNRHTHFFSRQPEQCLMRVRCHFPHIGHSVKESSGISAIGRAIGVAHDQSDGFRPDVQFLGNGLRVISCNSNAGFCSPRASNDRVVASNLKPGFGQRRIDRSWIFSGGCSCRESNREH